jgi:ComF family protein
MTSVTTYGTARAICQFSGPIRKAIHAFKYENKTYLAKTLIGLMEKNHPALDIRAYDLLVPVPLHKNRLRQRGYNQSLLLARELHRWYATPVNDRMVRRVRDCAAQIELVGAKRLENVKGVFSLGDDPTGKTILLVDDVLTTGATVSECAKVLLRGGARVVDVLTVARAL